MNLTKLNPPTSTEVEKARFSFLTITTAEEIKHSRFDIVQARREECARNLGEEIVNKKGWNMEPEGTNVVTRFSAYVLTPKELKHLIQQAELRGRIDERKTHWLRESTHAQHFQRLAELQAQVEQLGDTPNEHS